MASEYRWRGVWVKKKLGLTSWERCSLLTPWIIAPGRLKDRQTDRKVFLPLRTIARYCVNVRCWMMASSSNLEWGEWHKIRYFIFNFQTRSVGRVQDKKFVEGQTIWQLKTNWLLLYCSLARLLACLESRPSFTRPTVGAVRPGASEWRLFHFVRKYIRERQERRVFLQASRGAASFCPSNFLPEFYSITLGCICVHGGVLSQGIHCSAT